MKKKHSRNREITVTVNNMAEIVVFMQERSKMALEKPEVIGTSDAEVSLLQESARKQTEELKLRYYATNTPIVETTKRTFSDLAKRFVQLKREQLINSSLMPMRK